MKLSLTFLASFLLLGACKKTTPTNASELSDASVTAATIAAPKEARSAPTSEVRKEAVIVWRAVAAAKQRVSVSLQVDGETYALGSLDATTTGAESGTTAACQVRRDGSSKTKSTFTCGGTPAFNFLTAELRDGSLVVTRTTGIEDGDTPTNVKKVELRREPSSAAAMAVRPFVATKAASKPDAKKNCETDRDCANGEVCLPVRDFSSGQLGPVLGNFCE